MTVEGLVREWHPEEGWGVLDSPETPGGCWAHFSAIDMDGYRELHAGQRISFTYNAADQDGYTWNASHINPEGVAATSPPVQGQPSGAYRSGLSISWDDDRHPDSDAGLVDRPEVVVLCGSVRFADHHHAVHRALSLQGRIVLPPVLPRTSAEAAEPSQALGDLHLRKIDLADRIHVINPEGYVGDSTPAEIEYAVRLGKKVTYEW